MFVQAFGILVPALFVLVVLMVPAWLMSIECVALMELADVGAHQSIQRMLVAYPIHFASSLFIISSWIVTHFLLFDFGFSLGCWIFYELSIVLVLLGIAFPDQMPPLLKPRQPLRQHEIVQVIDFKECPYDEVIEFRNY